MATEKVASGEFQYVHESFDRAWTQETARFIERQSDIQNTHSAYKNDLGQIKSYLDREEIIGWEAISKNVIAGFFEEQKRTGLLADSTLNRRLAVVRGFVKWLALEKYPLPSETPDFLRVHPQFPCKTERDRVIEKPPLSKEDLSELYDSLKSRRDKVLFGLLQAGFSPPMIAELTVGRIDSVPDQNTEQLMVIIPQQSKQE